MAVHAYKDNKGRTRYRVTFSRNGRRLVDERLPAGTNRESAETYYSRIVGQWFSRERLGVQEIPLISEIIREYEKRIIPTLKAPVFARQNIAAVAPFVIGKTLDKIKQAADELRVPGGKTTRIHRLRFLRTLARYAVRWGAADRDYGVTIQIPAVRNERHFYPRPNEVGQILRHMTPPMRRAAWQLYYSGMRRTELWNASIVDGCYSIPDSKNDDPKLTPIALPLRKIVEVPRMAPNSLSRAFKQAARRAGFGHYRLHDLRHGMASLILEAGADLHVVADVLGHRHINSARRYAHRATESKRNWINSAATRGQVYDSRRLNAGLQPHGRKKKAA